MKIAFFFLAGLTAAAIGMDIGCIAALIIAGLGVDFSPSITAIFVLSFLLFAAIDDVYHRLRNRSHVLPFLGRLFFFVGAVALFPATLVYASGDDWFPYCIRIALIAGAVGHVAIWLLFYRRKKNKLGFRAGLEHWLLLTAAILTVACAIPSPGLWPYALGIPLISASRRIADARGRTLPARLLMNAGMLLCAAFLAAPMVF